MGIGDRFAHQGEAQLQAIIKAKAAGVNITPVWNKSFREHEIINSKPAVTRIAADNAVRACGWQDSYFVDADHIGLKNVDFFLDSSDYFTLDVADFIGKSAKNEVVKNFVGKNEKYIGLLKIPDIKEPFEISKNLITEIGQKYLYGVEEAGRIYRHITKFKKIGSFVVEVSMDETETPQTPVEMFFILSAISQQGIPANTIAPKFSGRFNKGVDYIGDPVKFQQEFEQDVAVINFAIKEFSLDQDLKLSVHSGSDKFSIYQPISRILKKFDTGLHLKTAGTTWLEELIGLAAAGGDGLQIVKEIYRSAYSKYEELTEPYAAVIDIDRKSLPAPDQVFSWDGETFAATLRHDQSNKKYNLNFRQLLHVGYKVAAKMADTFTGALEKYKNEIARNVTENIFDRHIKPLFLS